MFTVILQMEKLRLKEAKWYISWVKKWWNKIETYIASTQELHSDSLTGRIDSKSSFFDFCG